MFWSQFPTEYDGYFGVRRHPDDDKVDEHFYEIPFILLRFLYAIEKDGLHFMIFYFKFDIYSMILFLNW